MLVERCIGLDGKRANPYWLYECKALHFRAQKCVDIVGGIIIERVHNRKMGLGQEGTAGAECD